MDRATACWAGSAEQFDDYVKRVRIFATPELAKTLRLDANFDKQLAAMIVNGQM